MVYDMAGIELGVDEEISLRQFSIEDVDDIFDLIDRNREHLSQYEDDTAEKYSKRKDVLDSIVKPDDPSKLRFGIWANGIYVGTVNLTPDKGGDRAEIGYYLGKEFMGRRYMTRSVNRVVRYGLDDLEFSEIYGKVHRDNISSIAVLSRCGFSVDEDRSNDRDFCFSIFS